VEEVVGRSGKAVSLEVLSERGRLTQLVVWTGEWAEAGTRCATLLGSGGTVQRVKGLCSEVGEPELGGLGRYLVEADASIERTRLLGVACRGRGLSGMARGRGLLTGDVAVGGMFTSFEVLEHGVWNERRARRALEALDAGIVEVKTRGKAVDPDAVAGAMRGKGDRALTLFVLRVGEKMEMMVTTRVAGAAQAEGSS
jgi:hypothetical protein